MGLLGSINPFGGGNGNNGGLSESARMQEQFKQEVQQVHDSLGEPESIEERILDKLQNTKTDTETYRKGIAEIRSDLISEENNLEDRESEMKTLIDSLNQMSGDQASIT